MVKMFNGFPFIALIEITTTKAFNHSFIPLRFKLHPSFEH